MPHMFRVLPEKERKKVNTNNHENLEMPRISVISGHNTLAFWDKVSHSFFFLYAHSAISESAKQGLDRNQQKERLTPLDSLSQRTLSYKKIIGRLRDFTCPATTPKSHKPQWIYSRAGEEIVMCSC